MDYSVNGSICHQINLSTYQSVNGSICQWINPSTDQSVNGSIHQQFNPTTDQSINGSICQRIHLPTDQSINGSIRQWINLSMDQSDDWVWRKYQLSANLHFCKRELKMFDDFFWFKRVLDRGPEQRESKLTVLCLLIIQKLISYIIIYYIIFKLLIMETHPSRNQKRNSW